MDAISPNESTKGKVLHYCLLRTVHSDLSVDEIRLDDDLVVVVHGRQAKVLVVLILLLYCENTN